MNKVINIKNYFPRDASHLGVYDELIAWMVTLLDGN